jgi:hypothetical protein
MKLKVLKCPKEKCWHWICPGGAAEMSGGTFKTLKESFKKGKWVSFPDGGCSSPEKCIRLNPEAKEDFFEPC